MTPAQSISERFGYLFMGASRFYAPVFGSAPSLSNLQSGLRISLEVIPKFYSVHAPEVEYIAKGKAHKKYEFGCNVAFVTTSKSNWIVGAQAHHDNPYDRATLKASINQTERLTGVRPKVAFVDRGYRGKEHHPEDVKVHITGQRKARGALRKHFKRRNAIEPMIVHEKQDHKLERNHLKGQEGDCINALLSGCGFNLRKLLRAFSSTLQNWLSGLGTIIYSSSILC